MTQVAFDTNILVYAYLEPLGFKGGLSAELIKRCAGSGILPVQVHGETLNVIRRKAPGNLAFVQGELDGLAALYGCPPTHLEDISGGIRLAVRHRLQFWDAVIWRVSARAGARLFLSEDLQDGFAAEGMRVLNPFNPANRAEIDALLA